MLNFMEKIISLFMCIFVKVWFEIFVNVQHMSFSFCMSYPMVLLYGHTSILIVLLFCFRHYSFIKALKRCWLLGCINAPVQCAVEIQASSLCHILNLELPMGGNCSMRCWCSSLLDGYCLIKVHKTIEKCGFIVLRFFLLCCL